MLAFINSRAKATREHKRKKYMSLCQSSHYFMVSIDGRQVAEAEDAAEVSASN